LLRNVARLKGSPSASRAGLLGPEQARTVIARVPLQ